jgi:hypothetical protein
MLLNEDPCFSSSGSYILTVYALLQINHRITTKIQRRIYGHATNVEIRPLDEQKAVQAATDLIGEAFIFSVLL